MEFSRCKLSLQIINFKPIEIERRALLGLLAVKSIKTLHRGNQMITRLSEILIPSAIVNGEFVVRNDKKNGYWIFVGEAYGAIDSDDLSGVREKVMKISRTIPLLITGEEYGAIDLDITLEDSEIIFLKRKNELDIGDLPRKMRFLH
uniref:Beta protein n=1 Tax=Kimberley virus TaxID=318835 RepID=J9U175_9RHAB|nr:beta protein [Kimberley virus]